MTKTKIQWTDETWNPVTGCTKVSDGCKYCYAEAVFPRVTSRQFVDGRRRRFTDVRCHPERLNRPLHWRKPRRVFVNSMSDLFHEDVPDDFIHKVFAVMALAKAHTFQVLTKRPERMRDWVRSSHPVGSIAVLGEIRSYAEARLNDPVPVEHHPWPLPNVWLGVSCEGQATADERIPLLLDTPAAVRFVSAEPLLGPVDLVDYMPDAHDGHPDPRGGPWLDWVIVGGESGPRARPCDVAWIRSIIGQCKAAGVPCFVKQLGARAAGWIRVHNGVVSSWVEFALSDRKGGDPAEWPVDLCVREYP